MKVGLLNLLTHLLIGDNSVFLKGVPQEFNISESTVLNYFHGNQKIFKEYDLVLIRRNNILRIEGSDEDKEEFLNNHVIQNYFCNFGREERSFLLYLFLLGEKGGTKLSFLRKILNISESLASRDIDLLNKALEGSRVSIIRQRGIGTALKGAIEDIVNKGVMLSCQNLDANSFICALYQLKSGEEVRNTLSKKVFEVLERYVDLHSFIDIVEVVEKKIEGKISDFGFLTLFFHLLLFSIRNEISAEKALSGVDEHPGLRVLPGIDDLGNSCSEEYRPFVREFIAFLYGQNISINSDEMMDFWCSRTASLKARINKNLQAWNSEILYCPYLTAIEINELKDAVQKFFVSAWKVNIGVEESEGYLSVFLPYGTLLNKMRGLLVCVSGVGTAYVLAKRIEQSVKTLSVVEVVSLRNLDEQLKIHKDIDIIVTTIDVNIPEMAGIKVFRMSFQHMRDDLIKLEKTVTALREEKE